MHFHLRYTVQKTCTMYCNIKAAMCSGTLTKVVDN